MILDTHVWLRYLGAATLSKPGQRLLERGRVEGRLQVAAVTLWEVALLAHERRLTTDGPVDVWLATALARSQVTVAPLDARIAAEAARLIGLLRDPADCQIAGSALHLGVPLATRDTRILEHAASIGLRVVEV